MVNKPRRGVLLLIVLALLAMFAMVAVAFVVLTSAERQNAERLRTIEAVKDSPEKQLNEAFNIVVRGSENPASAIKAQGLSEKIYGSRFYLGQIDGLSGAVGGQLLQINLPDAMHKVGCTLTMLEGPAAGLSTRIVGLQSQTAAYMLPFPGNVMPVAGNKCIVNGFPYSGAGFGYNPGSGVLDAADGNSRPLALLPNHPVNWNPPGGANCDYTAPDFQDTLLAYAMPDPGVKGGVLVPLPSLHRADLIAFWAKAADSQGTDWRKIPADVLRQVMFRPNANDHPVFCASVNPGFNPVWDGVGAGGMWDVDNDGDGRPDSVWVDLGFPVSHTADGRPYKPLFAILCLDLDGRLNLNAHGNLAQCKSEYYQQSISLPYPGNVLPKDVPLPLSNGKFAGKAGSWPSSTQLPRGQGNGPAEVNLLPLFADTPGQFASPYAAAAGFNYAYYQWLLIGNNGQLGRYGENMQTQTMQAVQPGKVNMYSPLNWNRWFPYGESYWRIIGGDPTAARDAYGTPPDTHGFSAIGLDVAGRPLYISSGGTTTQNAPYDIDLSRSAARSTGITTPDSPFSVGELERLIRPFDRDASSLPPRLDRLTGSSLGLWHRCEVTTESFSVPCAPSLLPLSQRGKTLMQHPVDVIAGGTGNIDLAKAAALLPWETMQGLKMNVNRPFGGGARSANGTMTTGVQVEPDQPGLKGETFGQFLNLTSGTQAVPFAYDAFGMAADSLAARQLYAKHLYVLMTLTCDSKAIETRLGSAEARARYIAQWAVNCVAYRDHNAIMIPFNYVVNPVADGWNPDGRVVHTVWGCKRPDLLITEALAIHDRRTDDLEDEKVDPANKKYGATDERKDPGKTKETDPKKKDPNFDQRFRPQGSLFVELFNPWSPLALQSRDLLVGAPPAVSSGVMLNQTAGDAAGASPVWRLIIVDPQRNAVNGGELPDPDDPTTNVTIERVVYFVPKTGMKVPGDSPANAIYTPSASKVMLVQAGQYAVIGPGEEREGPSKTRTFIGLDSSKKVGSLQGRYLTLDEGDLTTNGAVARNNVPTSPAASTIKTPVSLRIDTPRRLSVSEPINGYNKYEKDVSGADGGAVTYDAATEQYSATIDIPLDLQRDEDEAGIAKILNNDGTYVGYRIIYLQRLADPTRPYAPATDGNINAANPYRTIDAIPVDLTTFNGVSAEADPDNKPAAASPRHFEARQRGDTNAAPVEINLWKQEQYRKTNWDGAAGQVSNALYKDGLKTSLGYLNDAFFRFFGAPMDQSTGYQGDPPAPFPWFNWAYRPYVNEYELLQVPAASSSKLLANNGNPRMYYGYVDQSVRGAGLDAYSPISNFPHLLNLFDSGQSSAQGQTPQFHRVLAYLGVPTPYANMSVQARADAASAGAHWFHPPYNNISTYREPGRINLNTISSPDVFAGLVNYHPALSQAPIWDRFLRSRRGSGAGNMTIDANVPSRFMRPFRTPGGASLTPPGVQESPREVDVGLLRSDPVDPKRPLFQIDDAATGVPPQAGGTPDAFPWATMDYNRSSYFRYQGIQRLAGATTCHSNVFAVWLTIGYFEVVPARNPAAADAAGNRIYPDGYELGGELGSDGSDVVRHRAFYIFDRSLPHGFMRGQDINHDKAILLKRFVE